MIFPLMFFHWVADFLCQTDEMAINKSKCVWALTTHVCTYTVVMYVGVLLSAFLFHFEEAICPYGFAMFMLVNMLAHWTTDFFTSKVSSYFHSKGNRSAFFCTIGFDQFLHFAALYLTVDWIFV